MILGGFVILIALFALYIFSPFFDSLYKGKKWEDVSGDRQNLKHRKEAILEGIRDLEYDFKLQKISEEDYSQVKSKLKREAVEIMKELDGQEHLPKDHAVNVAASKPKSRKKVRA